MNKHLLIISQYVKWHTCQICSIIQINETPKITNILSSTHKNQISFWPQLIVNWSSETLPAGFIWGTQLLRNLLHRKINFFSEFLRSLLLYYSTCKIKMLETVIFFGLQAPHVSCTYHRLCATLIWH